MKKLSDNEIANLRSLVDQGLMAKDIGKIIGKSPKAVHRLCYAYGMKSKSYYSRWTDEQIDQIRKLANEGKSSREIGIIFDKPAKAIQKLYTRYNIKGLPPGCARGHLNTFWKGGVIVDKHGYILEKVYGHPYSNSGGYVRQHRLVVEKLLGRYLDPVEVVHHKDGNKQNNDPENLEVYQSNGEHLRFELKGKCPAWSEKGLVKLQEHWAGAFQEARQLYASRQVS